MMKEDIPALEWTGERYVPQLQGDIALEHLHRYALASEFVKGKRVLDIASGEGYGSDILFSTAASVVGVDIDAGTIEHAQKKYGKENLFFKKGSCEQIPLLDHSVDVVVSFETIEHLADHEKMLAEIKRVLSPDGILIISTPDKHEYTEIPKQNNPFHLKELYKNEFENLLGAYFKNQKILGQRIAYGSSIFEIAGPSCFGGLYEFNKLLTEATKAKQLFQPLYLIAFCSDAKLPSIDSTLCEQSLYETEAYQNISHQLAEKEALLEKITLILEKEQQLSKVNKISKKLKNLHNAFSWKCSLSLKMIEACSKKIISRAKFLAGLLLLPKDKQIILVFGHEATRTGAPIALLGIIKQLSQDPQNHFVTILQRGGALVPDYQNICQTLVLGDTAIANKKCLGLIAKRLERAKHQVTCLCSTVDSTEAVTVFGERGFNIVSLVYEMPASINKWFGGAATMKIFDQYSQRLIFPSQRTYQKILEEYRINQKKTCVIPPGITFTYSATDIPLLRKKLCNELGLSTGVKIVVGCGSCDHRKGFDLFIQAGGKMILDAIQKNQSVPIFLWVGTFLHCHYAVDHIAKIPENIKKYFIFLDERSSVEELIGAADLFFLSSREDPFPLVALIAAGHGVPIVLFSGTTGIEGTVPKRSYYAIQKFDIDTTCAVLTTALKRMNFEETSQIIRDEYSLSGYAAKIKLELDSSTKEYAAHPAHSVLQHKGIRGTFLKKYIHLWNSRRQKRKPIPEFHPGIYREDHMNPQNKMDPFRHYLKAGKPHGRWSLDLIPIKQYPISPDLRIALHLHIFYEDLFIEILRLLEANKVRPDLLITITDTIQDTTAIIEKLKNYPAKVEIRIIKNRGRDIGAFLTEFGPMLIERYDIIGHLHTKKTVHIEQSTGTRWREFLLENLLGGRLPMADIILGAMSENKNMGLVFPNDPYLCDWNQNRSMGKELLLRSGVTHFYEQFSFPVGNMFWARTLALKPLLELNLSYEDYPEEPIPVDGTILHALERVIPFIVEKEGYQIQLTHIEGITR